VNSSLEPVTSQQHRVNVRCILCFILWFIVCLYLHA